MNKFRCTTNVCITRETETERGDLETDGARELRGGETPETPETPETEQIETESDGSLFQGQTDAHSGSGTDDQNCNQTASDRPTDTEHTHKQTRMKTQQSILQLWTTEACLPPPPHIVLINIT